MGRKKNPVVDDGTSAITQDPMTQFIQKKKNYTDKEIMSYSRNMAEALGIIDSIAIELKEFTAQKKDEIEGQETIVNDCAARIRAGYEMIPVECKVTYEGNIATFIEKSTGEIVEKREITEEEQLRLNSNWVDAERVIKEANEKEE